MSNSELRGILEVSDQGGSLKRYVVREPVAYELEVQRRWAIPVAPVLFAAVGVPLGIRGKRGARSWGALSCTLVALSYYVISTFGRQLAEQGWVSPILAMWSPNVLLALVAVLLLRERETFE